jgi:hypothetical protein
MELEWCQNCLFLEGIYSIHGVVPHGTPYGVILTPWNLERENSRKNNEARPTVSIGAVLQRN